MKFKTLCLTLVLCALPALARQQPRPAAVVEEPPTVSFPPDGRWLVFRSNMFGPTHVFAVEVEKAAATKAE